MLARRFDPQIAAVLLVALLLAGCSGVRDAVDEPERAVAQIRPLDGNDVTGTITFEEVGDFVRITGTVRGLNYGKHGFHVHEGTSCEDYGGHFAPEGSPHGSPDEEVRHVGDLGNLVAEEDETADYNRVDRLISLSGGQSVAGHALIVHRRPDEYIPQPSGSSGPEIGCGTIRLEG